MKNITINWNSDYIPEICVYKYVDTRKNKVIYVDISGDIVRSIYYNAYKGPFKKYMPYIEVYSHNCVDLEEAKAIKRFLISEYKPILNRPLNPSDNMTISIGSIIEWTYRFELDLEPLYQPVPISTIRKMLKSYIALRRILKKYGEDDTIFISGKTESSVIDEFTELYAILLGTTRYTFSEKKHFVDIAKCFFDGTVHLEVIRDKEQYALHIYLEEFYYQLDDFKDIYPQITSQLKKIIQNKCEYISSSLKIREINDRMAFSQSEEMRKRCIEFMKESLECKSSVFVNYYC